MTKNVKKKKDLSAIDRSLSTMKMVSSDVCLVCKQQCERGIRYMERMSEPGAVGYGVPCILTRGKAAPKK